MKIREPKFKVGDKVRDIEDGDIYTVESINSYRFMQDEYWYNFSEHLCVIPESALELYIDKSKTIWNLQKGDKCYFIASDGDVLSGKWDNWNAQIENRKVGNVFLTKEEAFADLERRKIETEMLRLGGRRNFKFNENNFSIYYSDGLNVNGINVEFYHSTMHQGSIYFDSKEQLNEVVKTIGLEKIKKYIFGVNE